VFLAVCFIGLAVFGSRSRRRVHDRITRMQAGPGKHKKMDLAKKAKEMRLRKSETRSDVIAKSLVPAVKERRPEDLENLARASLHAGMAFSNSLLGIVHALAHPLGGLYDTNHGSVNAALLPVVLRYDLPVVREKLPELAGALGFQVARDASGAKERAQDSIESLLDASGATRSLKSLGVNREDFPELARRATKDICLVTSPREADEEDLVAILEKAY